MASVGERAGRTALVALAGNPNVGKLPEWRPYDAVDRATMVWNDYSQIVSDPIARQRRIMQPIVNL